MNETKRDYLRAVEQECPADPVSEVELQLSELTEANDYLHSIITDLERALRIVLREEIPEKTACDGSPQPSLVPVANAIRTNVTGIRNNVMRIRTLINRLGV